MPVTETSLSLPVPTDGIPEFCRKWNVTRLELFGSVLRDDFHSDSDVDVMVTFGPDAKVTFYGWCDMIDEPESMFARRIDLLTRETVEQSTNHYRRDPILREAKAIYEG